ncbi:unnamed protein product [Rotaria socialis]|uniref:Peptidase S1 domain-containing protein n=1 Tax=Rotaria socialis TaxID=392032 RepID=A0A820LZ38_9BILA|nr:unnamed protein product [Rotaria socialis]CAF3353621.1 unnamed protein product [Rotaria socialis]CAF3416641.1 unnamed protein product [Rotaria socialis]CAF3688490.1 unnamed protein product [Rotaria socialis]CAF4365665.1 unnamed protein product [Rotaria socialis]
MSRKCGKKLCTSLGQRIIGGSFVEKYSWPWHVAILGPDNMYGGTRIDARHVLTAAHCTTSIKDYSAIASLHDITEQ